MLRGHERLERDFELAGKRYLQLKPEGVDKLHMVGFRITLVPLSGPLTIDRPYMDETLFTRKDGISGSFSNGDTLWMPIMDKDTGSKGRSANLVSPILRGAQRRWVCKYDIGPRPPDEGIVIIEVMETGTINMIVKNTLTKPTALSIRWVLSDLANSLIIAEQSRRIGGNASAEYALELELRNDQYRDISGTNASFGVFSFGLLHEEDGPYSKKLGPDPLLLPRYRVDSENEFPQLLKKVMDDLYNAVGKPHLDDFTIDPID